MIQLKKVLTSSVGQKFLMAISGIGLVLFIIVHLLGNLSLYKRDGTLFNQYANSLDSYGFLVTIAEVGLALVFLLHIIMAIAVKKRNRAARPIAYRAWRPKDHQTIEAKPSNISSRNMFITGMVLLVFLILHVYQFRYGPGMDQGYVADVDGRQVHDLYRVVAEGFANPLNVVFYTIVMVLMGFHLRHGFWSAFQSLGVMTPRASRPIYCLGATLAVVLALGFLFIPIWMYMSTLGGVQ